MKRIGFILILIIFISSPIFAYDWSKHNIKVENTESKETETILTLKAEDNTVFSVRFKDDVDEVAANSILKLNADFRKWKYMEVKSLEFVVQKNLIQTIIIPQKYNYMETDILPHIPAGMMFDYTDSLAYNFRINADNNFIRIEGAFINENILAEKIVKAIKDPILYLTTDNPKFLLRKITDNQKTLEDLKNDYLKLLSEHKDLMDRHEKLKNAVMTLHNTGVFGIGVNEINKSLIQKIISLKKENPKLTKDEIVKALEKEKIEFKNYEVFLILSVYYNEFK